MKGFKNNMNYKYKEFDIFTVHQIKSMVEYDIDKALELFADGYIAAYRIDHEIKQDQDNNTKNENKNNTTFLGKQSVVFS